MAQDTGSIRVPPAGTRGTRMPGGKLLGRLFKPLMDRQVDRYRKASGSEQAKFMGFPILLLTTVGAKTGREHTHVLGGFPDGDGAWLIIASNGGAPTHPHWFLNLAKNPGQVWIQVGDRRFKAKADCLRGADRDSAYERVVKVAPRYSDYRKKTDREIPVIRLTAAA